MKIFIVLIFFINVSLAEESFQKDIAEMISRNGELNQAHAIVEARESSLTSSKLSFLPDLTVGYNKSRYYAPTSYDTDNLFVKSSLNLFKGGVDFSNYQGKRAMFEESKAIERNTYLLAEKNAVEVLLNFYESSKKLRIAKDFLSYKELSLKTSEERYQRGLTSIQEVNKTKIDYLNAKAQLAEAYVSIEKSRAQILDALGRDSINIQDWPLKKKLLSFSLNKIKEKELDINKRPDIEALSLKLESDNQNIKMSKRSLLPRVDLSYSWSEGKYDRLSRDERHALLSVSFPLFEGWRTMSQTQEFVSSYISTSYRLRDLRREIDSKWTSVKQNFGHLVQTATEREETLKLARELYRDNFKRFQEGRVSVNDLQLDQNRLLESENLANSGWFLGHIAYLEYCHEQGLSIFSCE